MAYTCAVRGHARARVGVDVLVDLIYYLLDILGPFFRVYSIYRFVYIPFTQTLVFPSYETRSGTCSEKACLVTVWIEVY